MTYPPVVPPMAHTTPTASVVVYREGDKAVAVDAKTKIKIASSTDHAEAIQKAIDHVVDKGGGKVYIKAGTYTITDTVNLTSNIVLVGEGIDVTILKAVDGFGKKNIIQAWGTETEYIKNIVIANLTVDGNRSNNPTQGSPGEPDELYQNGIKLEYVENGLIYNVKAKSNPWVGIQTRKSKYIRYFNCIGEDNYWWQIQFWNEVYYSGIIGCIARNADQGIVIEKSYDCHMLGCKAVNCKRGIGLWWLGGNRNIIANNIVVSSSDAMFGIWSNDVDEVIIMGNSVYMLGSGDGIGVRAETLPLNSVLIEGNYVFSSGAKNNGIRVLGGYDIKHVTIVDNVVRGFYCGIAVGRALSALIKGNYVKSTYPIYIHATDSEINNVIISGNRLHTLQYSAIGIHGDPSYINNGIISGNLITGESGMTGTKGIYLLSNARRVKIWNNLISGTGYGIHVNESSVENTVIEANYLHNISTPLVDNGTATKIKNNIGYITENSGTATIPAGSTSVTVEHGLVGTPSKVIVTPIGDPGDRWWVANVGDTSFDIVVATAPSADIKFYWHAEV